MFTSSCGDDGGCESGGGGGGGGEGRGAGEEGFPDPSGDGEWCWGLWSEEIMSSSGRYSVKVCSMPDTSPPSCILVNTVVCWVYILLLAFKGVVVLIVWADWKMAGSV